MSEPYRMPSEAQQRYNPAAANGNYGGEPNHLESKALRDLVETTEEQNNE